MYVVVSGPFDAPRILSISYIEYGEKESRHATEYTRSELDVLFGAVLSKRCVNLGEFFLSSSIELATYGDHMIAEICHGSDVWRVKLVRDRLWDVKTEIRQLKIKLNELRWNLPIRGSL